MRPAQQGGSGLCRAIEHVRGQHGEIGAGHVDLWRHMKQDGANPVEQEGGAGDGRVEKG
jgi:hypothetical protein